MAKAFTAAAIERYKGGKTRREIRDAKSGVLLVVQISGSKSWIMRFRRPHGTPAKLTLGRVDEFGVEPKDAPGMDAIGTPLTLAAARALAAEVDRQRKMGRDVIADRAAAKHRHRVNAEENAANTFGTLAPQFIAKHAQKKTRRWPETARLLGLRYPKTGGDKFEVIRGGLCERWADKPVREIDGADIWAVVDETKRLGVPGLEQRNEGELEPRARAMISALSVFFGWLKKNRKVETNPCAGVDRPDAPETRDRVLSERNRKVLARLRQGRRAVRPGAKGFAFDRLPPRRGDGHAARRAGRWWRKLASARRAHQEQKAASSALAAAGAGDNREREAHRGQRGPDVHDHPGHADLRLVED